MRPEGPNRVNWAEGPRGGLRPPVLRSKTAMEEARRAVFMRTAACCSDHCARAILGRPVGPVELNLILTDYFKFRKNIRLKIRLIKKMILNDGNFKIEWHFDINISLIYLDFTKMNMQMLTLKGILCVEYRLK